MKLKEAIRQLDAYADGFLDAPHFRARVHMAGHLYDTLDDIYSEIERIVVKRERGLDEIRETAQIESDPAAPQLSSPETLPVNHRDEPRIAKPLRFRNRTIAEATRKLLEERGQLHGREIERLLKEGGYESTAEHFQSSLAVALGRDGGFENIGGNTWRLKPSTNGHPAIQPRRVPEVVNK